MDPRVPRFVRRAFVVAAVACFAELGGLALVERAAAAAPAVPPALVPPAASPLAPPTVTIKNCPGAICVGQRYVLKAEGKPEGGTYQWTVTKGATLVDPATGTGPEFTITGKAKSAKSDDVEIEVAYKNAKATCNLTVVQLKLKSVSFGGTGFHLVTQDGVAGTYTSPHWLDHDGDGSAAGTNQDRRFPVLYEQGRRVTVNRLTATVEPGDFQRATVRLRGTATDGHQFSGSGPIDKGTLSAGAAMTADKDLPKSVWFYDTYDVRWEFALTEDAWCPLGTSDNRVYVALARPASATLYETVCELACSSAKGATTEAKAVELMWKEFQDRDVRRKPLDGFNRRDGTRMGYWRPLRNTCQTLAEMLRRPHGPGACGAWAALFVEMTRVHGIKGTGGANAISRSVEVVANPAVDPGANGFLVKRWAFTFAHVRTGDNGLNDSDRALDDRDFVKKGNGYPFTVCIVPVDLKLDTVPKGDDQVSGNEITTGPDGVCDTKADPKDRNLIPEKQGEKNRPCILAGADDTIDSKVKPDDAPFVRAKPNPLPPYPFVRDETAIDLPGVAGQDNQNPPGWFGNHYIAFVLGKYYDPSYGIGPFDTQKDHENAAIDGITAGPLSKAARRNAPNKQELLYR